MKSYPFLPFIFLFLSFPALSMDLKKKRQNFPKEARAALLVWVENNVNNPYPSEDDLKELAIKTGIGEGQINRWFTNARRPERWPNILAQIKNNKNIQEPKNQRKPRKTKAEDPLDTRDLKRRKKEIEKVELLSESSPMNQDDESSKEFVIGSSPDDFENSLSPMIQEEESSADITIENIPLDHYDVAGHTECFDEYLSKQLEETFNFHDFFIPYATLHAYWDQ